MKNISKWSKKFKQLSIYIYVLIYFYYKSRCFGRIGYLNIITVRENLITLANHHKVD